MIVYSLFNFLKLQIGPKNLDNIKILIVFIFIFKNKVLF
jgi:hypothetical protein